MMVKPRNIVTLVESTYFFNKPELEILVISFKVNEDMTV